MPSLSLAVAIPPKYDNFMAQHPVLNDIKTGAGIVDALGSVVAAGGAGNSV